MTSIRSRSYSEMITYPTFLERFEYLSLAGRVGEATFGFERWLNQDFYRSTEWRSLREKIIIRDNGCDLGHLDYEIHGPVTIHHIVPMTPEDFEEGNPLMVDPDNLISTTHATHNAIHYGNSSLLREEWSERQPGDTLLWSPQA